MRAYLRAQLPIFALTWQSCEPGERPPNHCKIIAIANARLRFELRAAVKRKAKTQEPPAAKPPKPPAKIADRPPQGRKHQTPKNAAARRPQKSPILPSTRPQKSPPDTRPKPQNPPVQQKRLRPKKMRPCK